MNIAQGAKLVWKMANDEEQMWIRILKAKYLDSNENIRILTIQNLFKGSTIWNFILSCKHVIIDHILWVIVNGNREIFGKDSWNGNKSLDEKVGDRELKHK